MESEKGAASEMLRLGACFVGLTENRLTVGNERFERVWRVGDDGTLTAESFRDVAAGREWLAASSETAAPLPDEARACTLREIAASSVVEAASLCAELTASGAASALVYTFQIFPGAGGVRMRLHSTGADAAISPAEDAVSNDEPSGVEQDPVPGSTPAPAGTGGDTLEVFSLAPQHLRLTQITFADQTDNHNELVFEQEWLLHTSEQALSLSGCLFYVHDVLTDAGLIFVKEAPLPHARPVSAPHDLLVQPAKRRFTVAGYGADPAAGGYAFATLAYTGGKAGRIAALQHYHRCLRPFVPGRDGVQLSNTWGDRNRDGRINAPFMAQEIEAGARLGVDVIQIDDGWQVGATSNSVRAQAEGGVWEGFYAKTDDFWSVNPERFPHGLDALVASAKEKGMRFGLWFGPDSADDFAHWQRDADTILRLHRELGIEYIKIDGVKVRSKTGERNLNAFFDHVLNESAGRVVFDLDVTAEVRPGYFSIVRGGPLFVENRYTDWHRYWPHHTLRNLWKLSQHIDPVRLRLEWLNHARNTELYAGDPLAPAAFRPDYLFATVMFAAPLGWFEVSNLPQSYFDEAAPLIAVWKAHRDAIFGGTILPLGDAPDGVGWTGFVSVSPDKKSAYVLVFREASPQSEWRTPFPLSSDAPRRVERFGGDGTAEVHGDGLYVSIPDSHRFFFGRVAW